LPRLQIPLRLALEPLQRLLRDLQKRSVVVLQGIGCQRLERILQIFRRPLAAFGQ